MVKNEIDVRLRKMKKIEIYEVVDKDMLERCLDIRNKVFSIEKGVPKEIEVDGFDCLDESCRHFLIRYQNDDVGTIRCLCTSDDVVRIQRFCFLKGYRGLGLGRIVMEYIEDYYKNQRFATIEMDAKYEVCEFYEKCGYKKVSDVFMEVNIKHIKMIKEI
ncbi:MAG: GNAT family N-acetyltransferase [Lachnospiraceae bacterium]|nr:GNAT family N-acetyltransferase [Lachnospiraceae bacterium]